jgi:hypothetical protein
MRRAKRYCEGEGEGSTRMPGVFDVTENDGLGDTL